MICFIEALRRSALPASWWLVDGGIHFPQILSEYLWTRLDTERCIQWLHVAAEPFHYHFLSRVLRRLFVKANYETDNFTKCTACCSSWLTTTDFFSPPRSRCLPSTLPLRRYKGVGMMWQQARNSFLPTGLHLLRVYKDSLLYLNHFIPTVCAWYSSDLAAVTQ